MPAEVDVSVSAINAFADCEGLYHTTRVLNLDRRDRAYPPTVGIIIHEYFERLWLYRLKGNPRRISDPEEAHDVALYLTIRNWRERIYAQGNVAFLGDLHDEADTWFALPDFIHRLMDRYYLARGRDDMARYKPVFVEKSVNTVIYRGDGLKVMNHGIVDLVTMDREDGKYDLWEHKSVVNKPPRPSYRFRDSQTCIYGLQLAHNHDIRIRQVIWNYLLQRDPEGLLDPDVLFNKPSKAYPEGAPSRKQGLDTNWQVWSVRMRERGYDPEDPKWADIRERIQNAETERFFYREFREILVNKRFLIGNYINWAKRIAQRKAEWAKGAPVLYNFKNSGCEFCVGYKLCLTRLRGGDERVTMREQYAARERREVDRIRTREAV